MKRRDFVRNTLSASFSFYGLTGAMNFFNSRHNRSKQLKDCFWLWGQDAGRHHKGSPEGGYRVPGKNNLGPREGADYFGIDRILRVSMSNGPFPQFD